MTDIAPELEAARRGALVERASELGTLVVTGKDRQTWLNGLVTCDLAKLSPGMGAFGLSVAKNGKMQAELYVVAATDRLFVAVPRERAAELTATFDHFLIMEAAEIADASADHAWVLAHGPAAASLAGAALEAGAVAAAPVDRTGLGGVCAVAPAASAAAVAERLLAELGDRGAPATPEGLDQLRLELGLGRWGTDYDGENYPQEAALERLAVSFNKGCYLGQETVYMLEVRGHVKKKLVKLELDAASEIAIERGAPVTAPDGAAIGEITRAGRDSRSGKPIALGYVKYKFTPPGTEVLVGDRPARVAS